MKIQVKNISIPQNNMRTNGFQVMTGISYPNEMAELPFNIKPLLFTR